MAALFYEVKPTDLAMLASRGYNSAPRNRSSSLAAPGCSRGQNRSRYFAERRIEARAHPKEDLGLTSYPSERSVGLNVYPRRARSEEHTSELQSQSNLVCRLLLEKKKN